MSARTGEGRQRRRPQELRALALRAAEEVFGEFGYRGATMEQIATRAGVTRSVLTRHFPTKADLFEAVATGPLADFAADWARRWVEFPTSAPGAAVHAFVTNLVHTAFAHRSAVRLLLMGPDERADPSVLMSAELDRGLSEVTAIAAAELEHLGYPAADAATTIRAIVSMVLGYACLDERILPDTLRDPDALAQHLARLVRFGVALGPQSGPSR